MATLREVVAKLDSAPAEVEPDGVPPTIFARRPWNPESEAVVLDEDVLDGVAPSAPEFAYLLEVFLAREVLAVWSTWRHGEKPSLEQATMAIIHYAEHDAYQPVE